VLAKEALATKDQEKEKVTRAYILIQGKREYKNTLLTKAIAKLEILVFTLQKEEALMASNQFDNIVTTSLLGFLNPTIHAIYRQVDLQ
jgi:hypothetical protein